VVGDSGNDLVFALIGEELADLVRHIDETVGGHGLAMTNMRKKLNGINKAISSPDRKS
jgi:hypothetical protein